MYYLTFDIWADYAQFKKPFTTMSPQTFSIPTGTAIIGLISAIIGLDKNRYWESFDDASFKLAIGVRKPVKKVVVPINTLKTKSPKHFSRFEDHKRTTMEFIKDGKFRVWFAWQNEELFARLYECLKKHESHYTASLGLAWNLADFKFVGIFDAQPLSMPEEAIAIHSAIPKHAIGSDGVIRFEGRKVFANNIPVVMRPDNSRVVERYEEVLFDSDGNPIPARVDGVLNVGGDHILPI